MKRRRAACAALALCLALTLVAAACRGGAPKYDLTITFNASVTQANMNDVGDVLRSYDSGVKFLVRETFPPVGVARVATGVPNFCRTIEAELEGHAYIDDVTCVKAGGASPSGGDTPVSSTPLATP